MKSLNTYIIEAQDNHEKLQEVLDCVNEVMPENKGYKAYIQKGKLNKDINTEPYECVVIYDKNDRYICSITYWNYENIDRIEIRSHGGDSRHKYHNTDELKEILPGALHFVGVR